MNGESDLERLEREVQNARARVRQSEIKVEELLASVHEIEKFKPGVRCFGQRLFPSHLRGNSEMVETA